MKRSVQCVCVQHDIHLQQRRVGKLKKQPTTELGRSLVVFKLGINEFLDVIERVVLRVVHRIENGVLL